MTNIRCRQAIALAATAALAAGLATLPATPAEAAIPCEVTFRSSSWHESGTGGGFSAYVTITNRSAPIDGWTVAFTLPAGQTFRYGWAANWPAAGTSGQITATNLPWNGGLPTGQSTRIGFVGRWSGTYAEPTTFHLNGVLCNQEPQPQPSTRVSYPYRGAQVYVNPDWADQVRAQAATTPGTLGQQMARVATYPTAVWLDEIDAITAGRGLAGHLDQALAQQQAGRPMLIQLVLYDIPGRDCARRAAPGELTVDEFDQARYRSQFIDPIVQILGRPAYAGLRIAVIVEPGALPNLLLDRTQGFLECELARTSGMYVNAVRYALQRLHTMPNVYSYLEVPNSLLGGYESNFGTFVELYTQLVTGGPGVNSVTGFVTNAAQYAPLAEPFLPNPDQVVGGTPIWQSRFIDFSRHYQELRYADAVRDAFVARGFPESVGMVIDTGRNGWGGPDRPTQVSTSLDVTTYVNESRIDRRPTRASWCNQVGAGLGERPAADPAEGIHAYAWVTPPGESDGVASRTAAPDPDRPYLIHRNPCDPLWSPPQGSLIPSNALPDAPHYRRWFPAFFAQLVQNAYPPVS